MMIWFSLNTINLPNYEGIAKLVDEKGVISSELQSDSDWLSAANITVNVIFEQGVETLGL